MRTSVVAGPMVLWFVSGSGAWGGEPARAHDEPRPVLTFGIVADVQYGDKPTAGARRYGEARGKLVACVEAWNAQKLDFAIQLGDIIDGNATPAATRTDLDKMLAVFAKVKTKLHHVVGNHCLAMPRAELTRKLRLKQPYYDFVHGAWRFVVLDTMEISVQGVPADSESYKAARKYLDAHPKAASYNGGVGPKQKAWLAGRLAEAAKAKQRVIVFGHHPVLEAASHPSLLLWNHDEIATLFERSGVVVAYLSGHDHAGGYAARKGVHYVTLQGMVEAPKDGNAYGTVRIYPDRLVIKGIGKLVTRTLRLPPPAAAAKPPSAKKRASQ